MQTALQAAGEITGTSDFIFIMGAVQSHVVRGYRDMFVVGMHARLHIN